MAAHRWDPEPNPGSEEARAKGCICPVDDNNAGDGWFLNGRVTFDITPTCPLHGHPLPTLYPDGSARIDYERTPPRELGRGPVWVIDRASGRRYATASSAVVTAGELSLDDGTTVDAEMIDGYELVIVLDPLGTDAFGRALWGDVEAGAEIVVVWIDANELD